MLSWLERNSWLHHNQHGGVKNSGTEPFLLKLWQDGLEGLEDSRAAEMLSSIDYSKAFHRLDFKRCLQALTSKGGGQELLNIVASFLSGRKMTVKVGSCRSTLCSVLGEAAQGSLFCVFIFNCTVDSCEAHSGHVQPYGLVPAEVLTPKEVVALPCWPRQSFMTAI